MIRRCEKHAFVLLSVIFVLTLVAITLTRIASQGLQATTSAAQSYRQRQRDFAIQSMERAVLPVAANIFGKKADVARISSLHGSLSLGGSQYRLTVADESAKLNINHVFLRQGLAGTDRILKQTLPPWGAVVQQLRPRVDQVTMLAALNSKMPLPRAFSAWGDVYQLENVRMQEKERFLRTASEVFTCWGIPRLNALRAPAEALVAVLQLHLSQRLAEELATEIVENSNLDVNAWLVGHDVREEERTLVLASLSRTSTCYSLQTELLESSHAQEHTPPGFGMVTVMEYPNTKHSETDSETLDPIRFTRFTLH